MDVRNGGGQPAVTTSYAGVPESVAHNGGFHPSDTSQHDRR